MTQRPYRVNDRVSVHNYMQVEPEYKGKVFKGRVVCVNRKTRYMQSVVVLVDIGDTETIEAFCPDGSRYLDGSTMTITLGWPKELV